MTLEILDRTVFELIRLKTVSGGYLPNVVNYPSAADYVAAKEFIRTTGRDIVEIFGIGAVEKRDARSSAKITIDRGQLLPGNIGGNTDFYELTNQGRYDKKRTPGQTKTVQYYIRTISDSAKYDRIMHDLVTSALGTLGTKPIVQPDGSLSTDPTLTVLFKQFDCRDMTVPRTKMLERLFDYRVEDVFLEQWETIGDIPPLTSVNYTVYELKPDGTAGKLLTTQEENAN